MTLQILKHRSDIAEARRILRHRGLDCMSSSIIGLLRRMRIINGVKIGDKLKSWDVLRTIEFIDGRVALTEPILDIGAYASEILCALHQKHFRNLTGIDLNPNVVDMPHADAVQYVIGDFMKTPFPASTFGAITAISVIEHGFRRDSLLSEINRLLKLNGYFIASVDYWPTKINTYGISVFGCDWTIFSEAELKGFIAEAEQYGLFPVGPIDFESQDAPVAWQGKNYTFAWLVLQKRSSGGVAQLPAV